MSLKGSNVDVVYKTGSRTIQGSVSNGDAFIFEGQLYLKSAGSVDGMSICISIKNGLLKEFNGTEAVTKPNVKVIVED